MTRVVYRLSRQPGSLRARLISGLLAAALTAAGGTAAAQVISREGNQYRSAKNFALELRIGPYSPEVDEEFGGGKQPHDDFFGPAKRWMLQVELDYQLFTGFGSAAVGASVGYFRENAKAPIDPGPGQMVDLNKRSGDNTRLSLYPFAVLAVYRADMLWDRLGIPLVPYGKVGLNYTIWNVFDANDDVAVSPVGGRGRGGTRGWQAAAGVSLVLDFIDSGGARELDSDTGINHTHLFVEYAKFEVSGLGQSERLHVGDTTWMAGLMFEF